MDEATELLTEKLELIAWLARVEDSGVVERIAEISREVILGTLGLELSDADYAERDKFPAPPPLTKADLIARARASEEDLAAGRVHTMREVAEMLGLPPEGFPDDYNG